MVLATGCTGRHILCPDMNDDRICMTPFLTLEQYSIVCDALGAPRQMKLKSTRDCPAAWRATHILAFQPNRGGTAELLGDLGGHPSVIESTGVAVPLSRMRVASPVRQRDARPSLVRRLESSKTGRAVQTHHRRSPRS